MTLNESSEDYLEAILILSKRLPAVRSVDIANFLGFRKSSVSVAMKQLRENGYISTDGERSRYLLLTDKGREVAERVYERHDLFYRWFQSMGIPDDIAEEDACHIEHYIHPDTFRAMKQFILEHGHLPS